MQTNYDTENDIILTHWLRLFQTEICQFTKVFNFLVLSLWIAKQRLRQIGSTWCRAGWSGLIRMQMEIGRLSEVGSRMSWVMWVWLGHTKMSFFGKNTDIVLSRSGKILVLVSAVPLHLVSRCSMSI